MAEETQEQVMTDAMSDQIFSDSPTYAPKENATSGGINLDEATITTDQSKEPQQPAEPAHPEIKTEAEAQKPEFNADAYVKENFGFDTFEAAKNQIETWRNAKPPEPQKIEFANKDSELLYMAFQAGETDKVYDILSRQRELTKANELSPLEQIRLDIKMSNPKYTDEDVQDVLDEKYGLPEKDFDEYDDDYDDQKKAYDKQVAKIERKIKRDADVAYENLQKHKQDLFLSDIKESAEKYQTFLQEQEALQQWEQKAQDGYYDALEKNYSGFKGFNTAYKNKEVDVPVEYKPTDQELKDLKDKFSYGFNADEYFSNRWFDIEGDKVVGFKIADQMADIYLLENKQKIFDKIATDAAARAVKAYLGNEKNINLTSQNTSKEGGYRGAKTTDDFLTDKLWQ